MSDVPLQAVLRAICEDAKAVSSDVTASSSMQSFYAVLLCELLLTTQPVGTLQLPCITLHECVSVAHEWRDVG